MTIILNLAPDVESRLREDAARQEATVEEYTARLVEKALPSMLPSPMPEFKTGADVVAYWQKTGVIGMWADREDMKDSTEYVSRLRQRVVEEALGKQKEPEKAKD